MLKRLKPPYKIDKATGKKLPDYIDEGGIGYFKNRRWYSNIMHKRKSIQVSLNANEREERQADRNLGLLLQDLELGKHQMEHEKKSGF